MHGSGQDQSGVDGKEYTMNAQPCLDLDFVRSQFPAFAEPSLQGQAFFENAGGSYACTQVIGLLNEYYRRLKVQPYYSYPAATEAGMDGSCARPRGGIPE